MTNKIQFTRPSVKAAKIQIEWSKALDYAPIPGVSIKLNPQPSRDLDSVILRVFECRDQSAFSLVPQILLKSDVFPDPSSPINTHVNLCIILIMIYVQIKFKRRQLKNSIREKYELPTQTKTCIEITKFAFLFELVEIHAKLAQRVNYLQSTTIVLSYEENYIQLNSKYQENSLIMQNKGLLVGFANQKRKRLLQSLNYWNIDQVNEFVISKVVGFSSDSKKEMQQEIIQMITKHPIVNTIYIVLKYQRIDILRRQLSLIMEHFKSYINNICLVVSNFDKSKDKQNDQKLIKTKLVEQNNLKNHFQYQFGQTYDQDSIYIDSQEIQGKDIGPYFVRTICQQIIFEGNHMNLYPKINQQILFELEQFVNSRNKFKMLDPQSEEQNELQKKDLQLAIEDCDVVNDESKLQIAIEQVIQGKLLLREEQSTPQSQIKDNNQIIQAKRKLQVRQVKGYSDPYSGCQLNNTYNAQNNIFSKTGEGFQKITLYFGLKVINKNHSSIYYLNKSNDKKQDEPTIKRKTNRQIRNLRQKHGVQQPFRFEMKMLN